MRALAVSLDAAGVSFLYRPLFAICGGVQNAGLTDPAMWTLLTAAMFIGLKPLNCFVCLFCLWAGALPALAATWQEYKDAGLLAFENADYTESAEHFEMALIAAHEAQASHQELGVIL